MSPGRRFVSVASTGTLRLLRPDGTQQLVAGGGTGGPTEGAQATSVALKIVAAVGAVDGSIFVGIERVDRSIAVWQVRGDGTLHLVADAIRYGCGCPGDTMPNLRTLAVDSYSEPYITSGQAAFKIRADGEQQAFSAPGAAVEVGADDDLLLTSNGRIFRSPAFPDRSNLSWGQPYSGNFDDVVAAQLARFHTTADASQRDAWLQRYATGNLAPADIVYQLEHRSGYIDVVGSVSRLYRATYGREADVGGLIYWTDRRFAGLAPGAVAASFAGSAEFEATYGSLGDGAFVDRLYLNVLGRPADASGGAYWLDQINQGRTRGDVL